jgi:hypothetical protein
MIRRSFLSLLFVILLVFAQQSAMLHPYVHTADLQQTSQNDKQAPKHSEVCGQCVAVAAIGSAIGSQSHTFNLGSTVFELLYKVHQSVASEHFPDYHSRAPPTLA